MKVAIVCDWLTGVGGAERVVLELHKMFPDAPIYTSQYDTSEKAWHGSNWFKDANVKTLWLQKLPKSLKKFLPLLRMKAFSKLDLSEYDLVISSTGAEAKVVKTGPDTIHICYCLAPTHYYWSRYDEYMKHPGFGLFNWVARLGLRLLVGHMRRLDYKAAQQPDYIVGISTHIAEQIKKYYDRDADVIYPPVAIERFKPKVKSNRNGFVVAGRQTPYKRIDLAVAACAQLDQPLKVIGNGPEHQKLVKMAGSRTTFHTDVSDSEMPWHFQQAEAFIFPGIDDFGIVAVESMAAGTPVVAYKAGGALDYVKEGRSGVFFENQTVDSLCKALSKFDPDKFKHSEIIKQAERFSPETFKKSFKELVTTLLK